MIRIQCSAADAYLIQTETLTAGMVNLPVVKFEFSSDWDGLGKTAVVRAGEVSEELLMVGNQIIVPASCMEEAGVNLIIGVYGANSSIELPTVWCACGEILDGTDPSSAGNHEEATTSEVAQMLEYAQAIEQYAANLNTGALSIFASLQGQIGTLSDLQTVAKSNLVAAINELARRSSGSPIQPNFSSGTLTLSGFATAPSWSHS